MFSITYRLGDFEVVLSAYTIEGVLALDDAYNDEDDEGWIEWYGGECPVDRDTMVAIRCRSGIEHTNNTAKTWYWYHCGTSGDIVAYKVIKNA